ncbi:MAG: hypothetical protein WCI66_06235 [Gammaproteobacteria bacterium]|jgi:hypothetical protein
MSSEEIAVDIDRSETHIADLKSPVFFPVSLTKLVVLSICTYGCYEIYWFYQNWYLVKRREKSNIMPVARSLFSYFYCYPLFSRVTEYAAKTTSHMPPPPAGILAAGWIVTTLLWKLPSPYWLVSFAAVLFMLPIQICINSINEKLAPEHDRNQRFSAWNIAAVVVGGLVLILALIGTFLPEEQV